MTVERKVRVATAWLDGCSGCHMSILDMDERLIVLADKLEIVHSPYVDLKEIPADIDVAIVEGAVSSDEDLHKIRKLRANAKLLISLGDCAVTGNVPSMRNMFRLEDIFQRAYNETSDESGQGGQAVWPKEVVPQLRTRVSPVHTVVSVDLFVPGCPPPADTIYYVLSELLAGRMPQVDQMTRFGK